MDSEVCLAEYCPMVFQESEKKEEGHDSMSHSWGTSYREKGFGQQAKTPRLNRIYLVLGSGKKESGYF